MPFLYCLAASIERTSVWKQYVKESRAKTAIGGYMMKWRVAIVPIAEMSTKLKFKTYRVGNFNKRV